MTKEWKYVYNGFDYDELYDLVNDPDEVNNLLADKNNREYDAIVKDMSKKLWKFARETDDVCINQYIMVGLSSYGPGVIYEEEW
jgi:choline-sulfatase